MLHVLTARCSSIYSQQLLVMGASALESFYIRGSSLQQLSSSRSYSSVATALQDLVTTGRLKQDHSQTFAAKVLNALQNSVRQSLANDTSATGSNMDDGASKEPATASADLPFPRGAYLWGTIGSGKTMLLDLFCSSFSDADREQLGICRLHFHEFMVKIHTQLHNLQESLPRIKGRSQFGLPVYRYAQLQEHPVEITAQGIANSAKILCLDELHVSDVADALILSQLFTKLLQHGTFVLCTSNKMPSDLYKDGLNRQYFLPFVKLIQMQLAVVEVSGENDYRLRDHVLESILASPTAPGSKPAPGSLKQLRQGLMLIGPGSSAQLRDTWVNTVGSHETKATLDVGFGRRLHIPRQVSSRQLAQAAGPDTELESPAAFFTFREVCGQQGLAQGLDQGGALGPADMVALAAAYPIIFIQDIPALEWSQRNEARRLVTFIDTIYDMRCRLECSSADTPQQLFAALLKRARQLGIVTNAELASASAKLEQAGTISTRLGEDQKADLAQELEDEPISVALLHEEVVMYQRAISRLTEMCKVQATSSAKC